MVNSSKKDKGVFRRLSLAQDYILIVSSGVGLTVLLILFFSWYIYNSHQKEKNNIIITTANRIDRSLTDSFGYASHLMTFFGQEIQKLDNPNPVKITKLLRGELANDKVVKDLFSWTLFDWIDKNNRLVVSSAIGKIDKIVDMSFRSYTKMTPKMPWSLQFSQPAIGVPSGQWIIPAAMGITDKKGIYFGAIGMGFNILNLTRKIESNLTSKNTRFIIVTNEFNIVALSDDNNIERTSNFYKLYFDKNPLASANADFFKKPIKQGDTTFFYYHKIVDTPYIVLVGYNNSAADDIFYRIFYPVVTGFVLMSLLFISMSIAMRKWLVDPVVKLAKAAKQISQTGADENNKIYIPRPKTMELHILAKQLVRVQYLIRHIRKNNIELAQAKDAAIVASAAKTEFLLSTAHELRSPLGNIIMSAESIRGKFFGDHIDRYTDYAASIQQSGNELLEFIEDLLDVNKTEGGSFALEDEEWLQVTKIIDRAIKLNLGRAGKAEINIQKHYDENLPQLHADGRRLRQVLINLISNSIKYSPAKTIINVSVIMQDGKMHIIVADQGFGMNAQELVIAQTKWGTIKNENSGKVESAGLGLPLAIQLIKLHDAEFLITSEPGKGTIITIVFPLSRIKNSA